MIPVVPVAPDPDPESAADPWADRRAGQRRPVRVDTRFEVRRDERGPDVAVALLDVSTTGLKAAVRDGLSVGGRVLVLIALPSQGWVYRSEAVVCWQADGAEGTALVGLQLCAPLSDKFVVDLAEPETR